jgi:hypothetical protein
MPNDSDYRKRKAQEHRTSLACSPSDPIPSLIMYNYNYANEYLQKNFTGNPFGYACDISDSLWYMIDLKQVKENM